jgi:hypothetical protein
MYKLSKVLKIRKRFGRKIVKKHKLRINNIKCKMKIWRLIMINLIK